ncbi:ABC transporter ATP-binding protein [Aquibium sp. A9E412]|uniref:ABC transporter ATP-binding protein n=1 Tax=Aquibium sp. A9E412 TaxID=2976767 RepID=UPI0025AEE831|nr:ABC transporter ATP-binding protein [Aquibium sp. A9E412]MDN2565535.1 ABC transporter ATP-binding protein [Aquibium sp. A9E412]
MSGRADRPAPRLALEGITKRFGGFTANDAVDLSVEEGSVHAILGENGAGKSTLMNIIYGLYQPDGGRIRVRGETVRINTPRQALALGIGMVHQHFKQVPTMTVTENVILGLPGARLDLAGHGARIRALAETLGFEIDPHEQLWHLPVGAQQRVEILKLLYREADLLIFDEPTSVLTPSEVGPFFELLRKLKQSGRTVVLITHKLDEVMGMADRVSVMRHGRKVADVETCETDQRALARLMVGRDIVVDISAGEGHVGETVLELRDLQVIGARGVTAVDGLSLAVRAGEIVGLAGVDGNGQRELAEAIAGLCPVRGGSIAIRGTSLDGVSPDRRRRRFRLGYVPEDRQRTGLDLDSSIAFNMALRSYRHPPFSRLGWMRFGAIAAHAERLARRYDVRMRSLSQRVRDLSGGNQQKIILAREIDADPDVLVVSQPTKGLDVGAIEFVQKTLLAARERGCAILYISTELEDLLQVADRVAVVFRGRIVGEMPRGAAQAERLGLMMAGHAGTVQGEAA